MPSDLTPASHNPYAPPTADLTSTSAPGNAEDIRQKHLTHEASAKSIGFLYWFGAVMMGLSSLAVIIPTWLRAPGELIGVLPILIAAVLFGWLGTAMRRLSKTGRIFATILATIGLIGFPIGTIINAYILWLMWSAKGKVVYSDAYKDVIAATPHIKYKTPTWVWLVLLALIVLIVIAVVLAR